MAALALGAKIFSRGFRFDPTAQEAVTYYLPRLVAGEPLHNTVGPVVHHFDVYAFAPADLARKCCPLPRTGDRFFFTPSAASRKRAAAQASGAAGSWHAQTTKDIKVRGGDAKLGELKKLRYMSGGVYTDWLMDEYSFGAGAGEALCKMYVSPRADPTSTARHESAAYFFTNPPAASAAAMQPAPATASKRPAPPPPQDAMPPFAKRMRGTAVLPAPPPPQPPAPPALILSSLTAVRKMPFAPPQPSTPRRRGSTIPSATQPSPPPASAPPPAPPAPTRLPPANVRIKSSAPPQMCAPRRGSKAPLATQPKEQVPLPTPPVVSASRIPQRAPAPPPCPPQVFVQPKQMMVLDPFQAAMLREEAEEQTLAAAAPHPPPPHPTATATPALQDEDKEFLDELEKALETEDDTPGLQDEDKEFCDELYKALETEDATPGVQDEDEDDDWLAKALDETED